MNAHALGPVVYSFFIDHLQVQKGLRPTSIQSYRDGLRLFLSFAAQDAGRKITRLTLEDLTFERVLRFLQYLEVERHNHIRTRNQRLAILHAFFDYIASRIPEMLAVAQRVAAIPTKRVSPPEARYLTREEIGLLFGSIRLNRKQAERDRALLLFLYNTGARVQEVADLRVGALDLGPQPRVRLHGKGGKWRTCPLWTETAGQLRSLLKKQGTTNEPTAPVFVSRRGCPLTRFGIYKIVRRHTRQLEEQLPGSEGSGQHRISPHVLRHTTAVHLLEAGAEVNVIRGWLGHVRLETTNRYAEVTIKAKEAALRMCEAPTEAAEAFPRKPVWRNDDSLLKWLNSL